MNIAIIPARGGSKRIPRKNIKNFYGKPIIAWSIETALDSGCFEKVVVSTDDREIADIAKKYGAIVPFFRPAELSDDYTGTIPVIQHAIRYLENEGLHPELVCCIYATAPFISIQSLKEGEILLRRGKNNYAFSVTRYLFPIQRAIRVNENRNIEMFHPEHFNTRSQDLEEAYHDAGQFYWGTRKAWLTGTPIFSSHSVPVVLPGHLVQDIDNNEDWLRAELIFQVSQDL